MTTSIEQKATRNKTEATVRALAVKEALLGNGDPKSQPTSTAGVK